MARPANSRLPRIDTAIGEDPAPLDVPAEQRPTARDRALLIYTSGTTGLPKAAHVSHGGWWNGASWFAGMMDAQPEDRMYDCLPLYHSIGGVVAIGAMLVSGGSVLIRERFSASRFWDDVADGDCTIFQYIGELCRYLLRSPPHPRETQHRLRLACGNGLRGDVWEPFQRRFGIPHILEFYAATEGSFSLYNCEGKPGCDRPRAAVPGASFPGRADPVRCRDGRAAARRRRASASRCGADEIGEAIGRIAAAEATPADGSTATPMPPPPSARCCATSSQAAIAGSAPAT